MKDKIEHSGFDRPSPSSPSRKVDFKNRRTFSWKQNGFLLFALLLYVIAGGICGFLAARWIDLSMPQDTFHFILGYGLMVLAFCLAFFVQIFLHETGHLLAGLASGYSFCSFRFLDWMISRSNGKLTFSRLHVAGTGGQCLLDPPEAASGKEAEVPAVFYNLGGCLMNLAVGGLCFLGAAFMPSASFAETFLLLMGMAGIILALLNGIPLPLGMPNDGLVTWQLLHDPKAGKALYSQMKINALSHQGIPLQDMPASLVYLPEAQDWKNPLVASMAVFYENKLVEAGQYDEMDALIELLLETEHLPQIYRQLLKCDQLSWQLLKEGNCEDIFANRELAAFFKAMKNYPAALRTQYLYALIAKQDKSKALDLEKKLKKSLQTFPNPIEAAMEKKWMEAGKARISARSCPMDGMNAESPAR